MKRKFIVSERSLSMHYKAYLITREFPTDDVIDKIMLPFRWYENGNEPYPVFTWDGYEVGGRYNSFFELDMDKTEDKYQWGYIKDRVNVVYRSFLFDKLYRYCDKNMSWLISEWMYYPCLGSKDGILRVDGGLISDMKDFDITSCFIIIDVDGNAYARRSWNGKEHIENKDFDNIAKAILDVSKDYYIVTVDIHD